MLHAFPGEALGALAAPNVRAILEEFKNDPIVEVAETCTLALDRLAWLEKHTEDGRKENPYQSVDPTPPSEETDVTKLREMLLNEKESLFNRYRAMFALRNLRSSEAVLALADGMHHLVFPDIFFYFQHLIFIFMTIFQGSSLAVPCLNMR